MKPTIFFILLFTGITHIQAQFWTKKVSGNRRITTENRHIGDYDKLSVTGPFKVEIIRGAPGNLEIKADENLLQYIETYTKGNKLVIRINPKFTIIDYTKMDVKVPADYLSKITLTGSGEIFNTQIFDWKNLKLNLTGTGKIDVRTKVKHITATLVGSGDIVLTGTAVTSKYILTGSGLISAKELKAQEVKATLTGSGEIRLQAVNKLTADVMGNGNIYYYGEPDVLKIKTLGTGDVIFKKL